MLSQATSMVPRKKSGGIGPALNFNILILCTTIVITCSLILSVSAIKCYQCNSINDDSCAGLSLPNVNKSDKYLKECSKNFNGDLPFCRKVTVLLEAKKERRIVRSCGWIDTDNRTDRCFNADNEGFLETICSCFSDGCNSAPTKFTSFKTFALVFGIGLVFMFSRLI